MLLRFSTFSIFTNNIILPFSLDRCEYLSIGACIESYLGLREIFVLCPLAWHRNTLMLETCVTMLRGVGLILVAVAGDFGGN